MNKKGEREQNVSDANSQKVQNVKKGLGGY